MQRGIALVQAIIAELRARGGAAYTGATPRALDALESKLMVELPPTLRAYLEFDFALQAFGPRFHGRGRFGSDPRSPRPRISSALKLSEAMAEQGYTESRLRTKLVRLPNRPRHPWNALYLGEARRDGELVILGLEAEVDGQVRLYPRYTSFDLYLAEQLGFERIDPDERLEDLESHVAVNPELAGAADDDDGY
jgi:hypothetical protein